MSSYSNKPDAHYGLGVCKSQLCFQYETNCTEAIEHLKIALAITPNFRKANFNIGTCYTKLGDYAESIKYFNKAIENDKNNGEYYFNRGFAKLQLNKTQEACEDFNSALKLGATKAKDYIIYCK